jgi:cytoskeletal protein RodZ
MQWNAISEAVVGSQTEASMGEIGKRPGRLGVALLFASGMLALLPAQASAQFIPQIPFIPFPQRPYIGPSYRQSAPAHTRTPVKHEDQGETSDRTKEKDATQEDTPAKTSTQQHSQQDSGQPNGASRSASDTPATNSPPPANNPPPPPDIPFEPAR